MHFCNTTCQVQVCVQIFQHLKWFQVQPIMVKTFLFQQDSQLFAHALPAPGAYRA